MNTIINPINGKLCNIYDREGIEVLKSYIKAYKYGGLYNISEKSLELFDEIKKKRENFATRETALPENFQKYLRKENNAQSDQTRKYTTFLKYDISYKEVLDFDEETNIAKIKDKVDLRGATQNLYEIINNGDTLIGEEDIGKGIVKLTLETTELPNIKWPSNEEVQNYDSTYGQFDRLVNYILFKEEPEFTPEKDIQYMIGEVLKKFIQSYFDKGMWKNNFRQRVTNEKVPITPIKFMIQSLVSINNLIKRANLELLKTILKLCLIDASKNAAKNNNHFNLNRDGFPQIRKSALRSEEYYFKKFLDDLYSDNKRKDRKMTYYDWFR